MGFKQIGGIVIIGIFSLLAFSLSGQVFSQTGYESQERMASDFTLQTIEGETLSLSDFKGKVIILDFWATHCPPCRQEIPNFVKLYNKYEDKGLVVVGISLDHSAENVRKFCQKNGVNYPVVMGNEELVKRYGGIRYIPTTFVVDRKGNITKKFVGFTAMEVFDKEIEKHL